MPDGRCDTWAEWKAAVNGLEDDALVRYLRDVEGYTPERISTYRRRDSAVTPGDWATSEDAHRAMDRFFAFKRDVLDGGGFGGAFESQQRREAALDENDNAGALDPPASPPPMTR